jgi:hypothetical protein
MESYFCIVQMIICIYLVSCVEGYIQYHLHGQNYSPWRHGNYSLYLPDVWWGRKKWQLVLVSQVTDRAVTYPPKSWSSIFTIWRKHMDKNATKLDKLLKSQTWRDRRAVITHLWMTLTSVLPQTKSRILNVWQESPEYPQAVAINYKENMLFLGKKFIAEGCKKSRTEMLETFLHKWQSLTHAVLLGKTHQRLTAFLIYLPST